jgi:hypothetical protein
MFIHSIQGYDHVGECGHERLRFSGNRGTPCGWGAAIDNERSIFCVERSQLRWILAAPRSCIALAKIGEIAFHQVLLRGAGGKQEHRSAKKPNHAQIPHARHSRASDA